MNHEIKIINPILFSGWNDLVISKLYSNIFYSSNWAKVLVDSYRYKPLYFALLENDYLMALIPVMEVKSFLTGKRGVSLPFSDYCEPLITKENHYHELMSYIIDYGGQSGWKYIELRGGNNLQKDADTSFYYFDHVLELRQNEEHVFTSFRNSNKRNISKAIREGVMCSINNSLGSVKEFYRLNCITRKKHGLPPQPYYFFRNIYDNIISKNQGFIILAQFNNRVIAGAVFFHLGEKAIFKYGASEEKFHRLRANNLVMWEAIKWFSQKGFKSFSLGRTNPNHKGLLQFKNGWGAKIHKVNYYRYNIKDKKSFIDIVKDNESGNIFFKKMPIPLLKIVGKIFYKHMG